HHALGLTCHQVASAWSMPGWNGLAALTYRITNHGGRILRNVYMGVLADFDSKFREDRSGHRNDKVVYRDYDFTRFDGLSKVTIDGIIPCNNPPPCPPIYCYSTFQGRLPIITDGPAN